MKTTIELPDALLEDAKRAAAKDGTTLRDLVERGLRQVLRERIARQEPFVLRDARVGGRGLHPEAKGKSWSEILDMAYEGRGS